MFYSVILIKPTPCRKVLQTQHGHSSFQDLILFLKSLRDVAVLIFIGIAFQITASVLPKRICIVWLSLKSNKFLKSPNLLSNFVHFSDQTVYILIMNRKTVIMRKKFLICTFIIIINNS